MIFSILIVIFFALVLYSFGILAAKQDAFREARCLRITAFNSGWVWCLILTFGLICGVRYNFGVDNLSYIKMYLTYQSGLEASRENIEPLFKCIYSSMAKIGFHYSIANAFWAICEIGFVLFAVKDHKNLYPYIALYIILGFPFLHWTNGVRQCVVTCILIYLVKFISERKFLPYLVGITICCLVHKSAIILLPLYWLFRIDLTKCNKFVLSAAVVVCTVLGNTPTWIENIGNLADILVFMDYEDYANNLGTYVADSQALAWGPRRTALYLVQIISIVLFPQYIIKNKLPKTFHIYFTAFFVGVCLFNIFSNTSLVFLRPVYYFLDFQILAIPSTLLYINSRGWHVIFIIVSLLAYSYTIVSAIAAFSGGIGYNSPDVYKFFFLE